jgi:hypothetical protein
MKFELCLPCWSGSNNQNINRRWVCTVHYRTHICLRNCIADYYLLGRVVLEKNPWWVCFGMGEKGWDKIDETGAAKSKGRKQTTEQKDRRSLGIFPIAMFPSFSPVYCSLHRLAGPRSEGARVVGKWRSECGEARCRVGCFNTGNSSVWLMNWIHSTTLQLKETNLFIRLRRAPPCLNEISLLHPAFARVLY